MQIATVLWIFAIGASVGSFLNVVVYRLPLGTSLSSPPSRCPACETPILRRDNVPVLGWLVLRGHCRACGAAISPRYPLVEAIAGCLFVGLLFVEVASGGANLPVREPNQWRGLAGTLWALKYDLIGLYAYHLYLVCGLLAAALMAWDGASTRRLWPAVLLAGLVPPLVWPWLRPVPAVFPRAEWIAETPVLPGLLDGAAGTIGGLLVGGLLAAGLPPNEPRRRFAVLGMSIAVGAFLGWQAAVSVGVLTNLAGLASALVTRVVRRGRGVRERQPRLLPLLVLAAACTHLVAWRALSALDWWAGHRQPTMSLVGLVVVAAAALAIRGLATNWIREP